ncbi:hypothetical protein E2562_011750 [Oryza meyeriana var. granulata]|uniref:Uncharacterized protein n=1 Tax=Oryza meyeriana var. granulata TaxID=110450 RepID=A0A6G1CP64_9ORYZ|nr:hypothetical protein E2562_011750 [Oryza meyeriana var. granulata]
MPRLTPEDASLVLDHVVGDPSVPAAAANAVLAALPFPSDPTPRLLRAFLLRRLAADPVSASSLDSLQLLASLPSPATPAAAAHLAVAAYLTVSAPDFDAAAGALFARPGGRARRAVEGGDSALVSDEAASVADQFEAAVGNSFSQAVLRGLWGDRASAEERVRELVAAEWAAIGQSRLEEAAERIVGDGAVESWSAADEVTRATYCVLAGEQRTHEIQCKLGEPIPKGNQILTPEVHKVMDALKSSCANLHSVVEDPLPAAKAAADEVLATRMAKAVDLNAGEVSNQPAACGIAGPSAPADNRDVPRKGTAPSLMDWNPTARTFQWEDLPDPEGSQSPIHRPHLPSPRRTTISPLQPADNKAKRRKARKWCTLEEETLRKGVEQYVLFVLQ